MIRTTSPSPLKSIPIALLAVQRELGPIFRDGKNPHFKSTYITLDHLTEVVKPILNKYGISLVQSASTSVEEYEPTKPNATIIHVETMLMHESGEFIVTTAVVSLAKLGPQDSVAALTYGRRAGLAAALAVVTDEDDDGESLVGRATAKPRVLPEPVPVMEVIQHAMDKLSEQKRAGILPQDERVEAVLPEPDIIPQCPKCGGDMWDNRLSKTKSTQPDFKCKKKSCGTGVWPKPKPVEKSDWRKAAPIEDDDDLPFDR